MTVFGAGFINKPKAVGRGGLRAIPAVGRLVTGATRVNVRLRTVAGRTAGQGVDGISAGRDGARTRGAAVQRAEQPDVPNLGGTGSGAAVQGAGSSIKFGSNTKSAQTLSNQMDQRGWTESSVRSTVYNPHTTRVSTNKATGNPATVYYNKSGGHVIVDDVTKVIVQVSDNINPSTWRPDPSIINPFVPGL